MNIIIQRHSYSRYGIDGTLNISLQQVCHTCEHPHHYLPEGRYKVVVATEKKMRRMVPFILMPDQQKPTPQSPHIKIGNGPFLLLDGSIIIGERVVEGNTYVMGLLAHSGYYFDRLIDRLDKAQNRGEDIWLTIK